MLPIIGPTLTIAAAAKHLDLTEGAMRLLVDAKLVPATRTPQGWFVTRASVDRVLAEGSPLRLCERCVAIQRGATDHDGPCDCGLLLVP